MSRSRQIAEDITYLGIEWRVEGLYTPGSPGQLYGPPEKCYPPDPPDWENVTMTVGGVDLADFLDSVFPANDFLHRSVYEIILEETEVRLEREGDAP